MQAPPDLVDRLELELTLARHCGNQVVYVSTTDIDWILRNLEKGAPRPEEPVDPV